MQRTSLIIFLLLFFYNSSFSQSEKKEIFVKFTDNEIKADGILDEPDWALAKTAYGFYITIRTATNNPTAIIAPIHMPDDLRE